MACWTGEGWRLMDGRCCARTRGRNHPDGIDAAWSGRPPGGRGLRCSSCRSPCPVLPCKWGQRGAGQAHAGSGRQGHLHRRRMPPSSDSRIRAVFIHRRCSCPQAGDGAAIEIRALLIDRACSGVPVDDGRGSGIRAAPIHRSCSGHPMCGRVLTARWRAWAAKSPCCVCTGAWGKAPCRAQRPTRGRGDLLSQRACISRLALRSAAALPPVCDAAGAGSFAPLAADWPVVLAGALRAGEAALPSVSGTST